MAILMITLRLFLDVSCDSDQFQCGNGGCIPASYQCDGDDDCGDMSDERTVCVWVRAQNQCPAGQYRCSNTYSSAVSILTVDARLCVRHTVWIRTRYIYIYNENIPMFLQHCIEYKQICDDRMDCPNGDDEGELCSEYDMFSPPPSLLP